MTVRWSETALSDLENIHDYIARDKPGAANATVDALFRAGDELENYPNLGHPGRRKGTRELVHVPYVIVYKVMDDIVHVLAVFHGHLKYE